MAGRRLWRWKIILEPVPRQQWLDGALGDSGTPTEGSKLDGWVWTVRPISGLKRDTEALGMTLRN